MGRPSKRTPEVVQKVIEGLSKGIPLTIICQPDDMPCDDTIRIWAEDDEELSRDIARARIAGHDQIAMDALRIADTPMEGIVEKTGKDGVEVTRADMLGHRKLQVETRLKLLAKWDPKRYGEKIAQEISGPDGGPVQTESKRTSEEQDAFAEKLARSMQKYEAGQ
jgi:hypothetical protein